MHHRQKSWFLSEKASDRVFFNGFACSADVLSAGKVDFIHMLFKASSFLGRISFLTQGLVFVKALCCMLSLSRADAAACEFCCFSM